MLIRKNVKLYNLKEVCHIMGSDAKAITYKIINSYITVFQNNSECNTCFLKYSQSSVGVKALDRSLFIQPLTRWSRGKSIYLQRGELTMLPRLIVNEMKCSKLFLPSPQLGELTIYWAYWLNYCPASLSFLQEAKCLQNLYVETSYGEVDSWRES